VNTGSAAANQAVVDRISLWPFVFSLLFIHAIAFIFDRFSDDSPASGIAILFCAPGLLLIVVYWLSMSLLALTARRKRLAFSRFLGPLLGVAVVAAMTAVDLPPWLVRFELTRPYYLARVWTTAAQGERKRVVFDDIDKEMWSGHESRRIIYDNDEPLRRRALAAPRSRCFDGTTLTTLTDLGFGFYAEERQESYGLACSPKE
jgi:hypothetical protein